jgi:hypothetical protein
MISRGSVTAEIPRRPAKNESKYFSVSNNFKCIIMKKLLFFFCALTLMECNSNNILTPQKTELNNLEKQWVHSREEETDSVQIYRPTDYKELPASRFREVYYFEDSSECKYLVLAPNDAHYFEVGTWAYNDNNQTLVIYNSSQQTINRFKIILVNKVLLKFIKIK